MNPWSLRPRLAPTILFTCTVLFAGGLAGQQDPGAGEGGGFHRMGGRGGRGLQMPDPVVLSGPPAPDSMAALVGLEGDAQSRYATMYENFMASTRTERDSLATLREARRNAWASGEGPRGGGGMDQVRQIRDYLTSKQKEFDQALPDVLSADQIKKYRDWRDQRRHEAEQRMRDRRGGGPGEGPPS